MSSLEHRWRLAGSRSLTRGLRRAFARRWAALVQMAVACLLALSVSGTAHAAGELIENAVHLAAEGHTAHADMHPDRDREHDCTGSSHTCSCCVTQPAVVQAAPTPGGVSARSVLALPGCGQRPAEGIGRRIDRPPQS